jgi:hypothetical protein
VAAEYTDQMAALAEHASQSQEFFGAFLFAFQQQEKLGKDGLLRHLETTPELLTRLALCRRPVSDSPNFIQEIRQISEFTQIDAGILAAILRQVEALDALASRGKIVQLDKSATRGVGNVHTGLLAAARDREAKPRPRSRRKSPPSKRK